MNEQEIQENNNIEIENFYSEVNEDLNLYLTNKEEIFLNQEEYNPNNIKNLENQSNIMSIKQINQNSDAIINNKIQTIKDELVNNNINDYYGSIKSLRNSKCKSEIHKIDNENSIYSEENLQLELSNDDVPDTNLKLFDLNIKNVDNDNSNLSEKFEKNNEDQGFDKEVLDEIFKQTNEYCEKTLKLNERKLMSAGTLIVSINFFSK
jgi:hypothetical protein